MPQNEKTQVNARVARIPSRGKNDRTSVYAILDNAFLCHVGFRCDGHVYVIPTLYARHDDRLFLHGSAASRLQQHIAEGNRVCIAVTAVRGLVLARSAFHHSMNYESAVIFGTGSPVRGQEEKMEALRRISENICKGRWDEVRKPSEHELRATMVVAVEMSEASAKIRTGPPVDDEEDYALPIWAGVVPISHVLGEPIPDPLLRSDVRQPEHVSQLMRDGGTIPSLQMTSACQGCGAKLDLTASAYICSYECTFCPECTQVRHFVCPNCSGELVTRPRRGAPDST